MHAECLSYQGQTFPVPFTYINSPDILQSGLESSKYLYLILETWCKILSTWYLFVLDPSKFKSTWYLRTKVLDTGPKTFKYLCQINKIQSWNFGIYFLQHIATKHYKHKLLKWFILCAHSMGSLDIKLGLPPLICRPRSTLTHWPRRGGAVILFSS